MKENGKIFAVIVVILILLIVSFNFIKKSNYNVREEAKATAEQFADAYFTGNIDGVKAYLVESFMEDVECYHPNEGESADVEIMQVKGLQNITIFNKRKTCHISVEYLAVYEDSLSYLEMNIIREKSGWKIISYWLEK